MFNELKKHMTKPELYAPSTNKFGDDEHISKFMLEAHLNPDWDAATRKHEFLDESAAWISKIAPPSQYTFLLDLGCGPGLYAERFSSYGYSVVGFDFSNRSIAYAKEQTLINKSEIEYHYKNYLIMDYTEQFDVITLIYGDYAALPLPDRYVLLKKIYQALKPNGKFIFDVFTPLMRKNESHLWQANEGGGFWSNCTHVCLESVYQYDENNTELRQAIVIAEESVNCYNIWDCFFTKDTLLSEIQTVDFKAFEFYDNVAGKEFSNIGETICVVCTK